MDVFHAFILGVVQGTTEFLPISSSGFLILIPEFFGWDIQSLSFDSAIHLATLLAVVTVLRKDILLLSRKIFLWLALATVPVFFFGYILKEVAEVSFRSKEVVAVSFIVWGIVLYFADRAAKTKKDSLAVVGWRRALAIGFAQVLALVPGTSRSGITITAGLFSGLSRQTATTFSFLLSIPTIAGAGFLGVFDLLQNDSFFANTQTASAETLLPLIVGAIAAFIMSFLTISFLLSFVEKHTYSELAIFRVILGVLILLF